MNELSQNLFHEKVLQYHQTPAQPTNELFGLEYLRQQSEFQLSSLDEELDNVEYVEVDEGLGDERMIYQSALSTSEDMSTFTPPVDSDDEDDEEEPEGVGVYLMYVPLTESDIWNNRKQGGELMKSQPQWGVMVQRLSTHWVSLAGIE